MKASKEDTSGALQSGARIEILGWASVPECTLSFIAYDPQMEIANWSYQHYQLEVTCRSSRPADQARTLLWVTGLLERPRAPSADSAPVAAEVAAQSRRAYGDLPVGRGHVLPVAVFVSTPASFDVAIPIDSLEQLLPPGDDSPSAWSQAFTRVAEKFEALVTAIQTEVDLERAVVCPEDAYPETHAPKQSFYFDVLKR